MKNAKIIKNIYVVFICLAATALIYINIYQHQKIIRLSQRVNQQASVNHASSADQTSKDKGASRSIPAKDINKSEADDLKYQLEAAKEELDMVNKELSDEAAKKAELKKKELESFEDYMNDPGYENNIRRSLETNFRLLFKELDLSDDKLEKFKDLLVNQQLAYGDFILEMQRVTATQAEEKRTEFKQRAEELNKEKETEVIELIGKDDFEKYKTYIETAGERRTLYEFMESAGSDLSLTEDQLEQLVNAMYEAGKTVKYENIDDNYRFPAEMYDEGYIARSLDHESRKAEAYLTAAQNILSPSQTEQFRTYLMRQHDEYESSMKMQALKYGTSAKQKGGD